MDRLSTPVFLGFPVAQLVKNPPAVRETLGLISGLGRSSGEGNVYPAERKGSLEKCGPVSGYMSIESYSIGANLTTLGCKGGWD